MMSLRLRQRKRRLGWMGWIFGISASCFLCLFFGVCSIAPLPRVWAMDTPLNATAFSGLEGVGVIVEPLSAEIETDGLTAADIASFVSGRLRQSGIPVLTEEDFMLAPGRPAVYVNCEVSKLTTEQGEVWGYLCAMDIALTQNVYLARRPDLSVPATTWEAGGLGLFENLHAIRKKIEEAVDVFIQIYQAANKPEKIERKSQKTEGG